MLTSTIWVLGDTVRPADALSPDSLAVALVEPEQRQGLLATILSVEDGRYQLAYAALICYGALVDRHGQPTHVDLLRPLDALRPAEQQTLRALLVRQSWPAWARAPLHVRALLGRPEPPLALADAARRAGASLATLASAAVRERLPTIHVGDRHLVYLETIGEAYDRGLLHTQRGRPAQRRGR